MNEGIDGILELLEKGPEKMGEGLLSKNLREKDSLDAVELLQAWLHDHEKEKAIKAIGVLKDVLNDVWPSAIAAFGVDKFGGQEIVDRATKMMNDTEEWRVVGLFIGQLIAVFGTLRVVKTLNALKIKE